VSFDWTIKIWNTNNGTLKRVLIGHARGILGLATLTNGDIASGSDDGIIKIWNSNDGTLKRTFTWHTDGITSLTTLLNGDLVSGVY
jgi:WD40 repeat protein